jgi:hypothetical protein
VVSGGKVVVRNGVADVLSRRLCQCRLLGERQRPPRDRARGATSAERKRALQKPQ